MKKFALAAAAALMLLAGEGAQAADEPLILARDGFMYVGGKTMPVNGREYLYSHMYVEIRLPAAHGRLQNSARNNAAARFVSQEKFKLWPQAALHTQWPGNGEADDPATLQLAVSQLPAIEDFDKQQPIVRDALIALVDKIGPSILMTHSQGGAFGWPVADARPDKVKAILAVEPNGPPGRGLEFIGPPDYFKEGKLALTYGITSVPLTYAPALADPSDLKFVKEDKPDGPGLATCWQQAAPARQLVNLKMPILVLTSEASYQAPYDHCTVKFLQQPGLNPSFIGLADLGINANS